MKLVDEGIDRLAIARQRLLEPSGCLLYTSDAADE